MRKGRKEGQKEEERNRNKWKKQRRKDGGRIVVKTEGKDKMKERNVGGTKRRNEMKAEREENGKEGRMERKIERNDEKEEMTRRTEEMRKTR